MTNLKYLKKVLPLKPIPTSEQYSNDKNISINNENVIRIKIEDSIQKIYSTNNFINI